MLELFVFTTLVLVVVLVIRELKTSETKESRDFWFDRWQGEVNASVQLQKEFDAAEKGISEIEENYQQELLSEYDKVEAAAKQEEYFNRMIEALEAIRQDHEVHCLPRLGFDILDVSEEEPEPIYERTKFLLSHQHTLF